MRKLSRRDLASWRDRSRMMIPNVVTLLALGAGMTAIRLALLGRFEAATIAIVTAGVFDGLDGRVARRLNVTSAFGAQLDSLSDFLCFGVAPGFLLYLWTVSELSSLGWAIVVLFGACCALRLARFNTQLDVERPPYARNFFTGVPAPAGAGLALAPMFLDFQIGSDFFRTPLLNGAVLATTSALMVSRLPTYSLKGLRVSGPTLSLALVVLGATLVFRLSLWVLLLGAGAIYLVSIPVSVCAYGRMRRDADAARAAQTAAAEQ